MDNQNKSGFVGKSEEIFLTQYAFDLKVEELKTATNPKSEEKKITVHVYSNNAVTIAKTAKAIYDSAVGEFKNEL